MSRPRFYLVIPGPTEIQRRFWESKKITRLTGTFDEFVATIDRKIGAMFREVKRDVPVGNLAISARFIRKVSRSDPGQNCWPCPMMWTMSKPSSQRSWFHLAAFIKG